MPASIAAEQVLRVKRRAVLHHANHQHDRRRQPMDRVEDEDVLLSFGEFAAIARQCGENKSDPERADAEQPEHLRLPPLQAWGQGHGQELSRDLLSVVWRGLAGWEL